jgi:hypothetical protein
MPGGFFRKTPASMLKLCASYLCMIKPSKATPN